MKQFYITFGSLPSHKHKIDGVEFGLDTVAVITAETITDARNVAFELFGKHWAFCYDDIETIRRHYAEDAFIDVELPCDHADTRKCQGMGH